MKLSLLKKLIGGFILISLFTGIIAISGIYSIYQLEKSLNELTKNNIPSLLHLLQTESKFNELKTDIRSMTHPYNSNDDILKYIERIKLSKVLINNLKP